MKKLLLLVFAVAMAAMSGTAAKGPTLTATCVGGCTTGGDPEIIISGTGFQTAGHNTLSVIVWDSPNAVSCLTPDKQGNFSCTTTIDTVGWYNIVAYQNSKVLSSTNILVD